MRLYKRCFIIVFVVFFLIAFLGGSIAIVKSVSKPNNTPVIVIDARNGGLDVKLGHAKY